MSLTKRVGKKMWFVVGRGITFACHTRSFAREIQWLGKDIIVEVTLTPYQQKKLNEMQGAA